MTLDLEDLQRKARAAKEADKTHTGLYPAGVWHVVKYGDEQSPGICVHSGDAWRVCFMATIQSQKDYDQQMAKAEHIAAANPETVLALIAELRQMREALEFYADSDWLEYEQDAYASEEFGRSTKIGGFGELFTDKGVRARKALAELDGGA